MEMLCVLMVGVVVGFVGMNLDVALAAKCHKQATCQDNCVLQAPNAYHQCKEVYKKAVCDPEGVGVPAPTGVCGKLYTNPPGETDCTSETQSTCGSAKYLSGTCTAESCCS